MTDPTRITYRELTQREKDFVNDIKRIGALMMERIVEAHGSRGVGEDQFSPRTMACAKSLERVQEAVMWSVYGLTG